VGDFTLPPFNSTVCPKCGSEDADTRHEEAQRGGGYCEPYWETVECMARTCKTCRYVRYEAPKDAA
jgi:hypothetical protein